LTGQLKHSELSQCCTVGKDKMSLHVSPCAADDQLQQFNIAQIKTW